MPQGRFIVLAAVTLLAACASQDRPRYSPPAAGSDRNAAATEACWSDANRRAEREYLRDSDSPGERGFSRAGGIEDELARRDAKRYRQRLYDACLRRSGVAPDPR